VAGAVGSGPHSRDVSDREFVADAAIIHLKIEALHRRTHGPDRIIDE
jgi:hypothetical protein